MPEGKPQGSRGGNSARCARPRSDQGHLLTITSFRHCRKPSEYRTYRSVASSQDAVSMRRAMLDSRRMALRVSWCRIALRSRRR